MRAPETAVPIAQRLLVGAAFGFGAVFVAFPWLRQGVVRLVDAVARLPPATFWILVGGLVVFPRLLLVSMISYQPASDARWYQSAFRIGATQIQSALKWMAMTVAETLRSVLEQMPAVRLAVLFGSAATGAERPGSDLDVGVTLEKGAERSPRVGVALERVAGRRVDLIWLDEAPPLLRFEIARDGVLLVERVPHGWADFRAHAMIDWWDWAPTARMMHRVAAARLKDEARRGPS